MRLHFATRSSVVVWLILHFGLIIPTAHCDEVRGKKYREFVSRLEFEAGKLIDKSTKLFPEDVFFLNKLEKIDQSQRSKGDQDVTTVLEVIKISTSIRVIEKALSIFYYFKGVPLEVIRELHYLAYCDDENIKCALSSTLGWFRQPESIPALIHLVCDNNLRVSFQAMRMLRYFGIGALAAFPYIKPYEFLGYDELFLAKVLRHIFFLVFVPAGQQILPSATRVRQRRDGPFPRSVDSDYITLPSLEELVFPQYKDFIRKKNTY